MKPAVLCISRDALSKQNIPTEGSDIFDLDFDNLAQDAFSFINRNIVDCSEENNPSYYTIGTLFPQILAYTVIKHKDKYLTYSRAKGAETRLHGSLSLGFGGHVDIQDGYALANLVHSADIQFQDIIVEAAYRELEEELTFNSDADFIIDKIIVDTTNNVGHVHVGLPIVLELDSEKEVKADPNEIALPVWKTKEELLEELDLFENWSKLVINKLL